MSLLGQNQLSFNTSQEKQMQDIVNALEDEIQFWKRLIAECNPGAHSPEYQRMLDALGLAEYKLEKYIAASVMPKHSDTKSSGFN